MHLTKKKVQIIKLLLSSPTFISSYTIEQYTGVHHRLIREEINQIKKMLKPLRITLISKPSKGYTIAASTSHSMDELEQVIKQFEKNYHRKIPDLPEEREVYILQRLLTTKDFIKIDTLAEELITSRTSISNALKQVRKTLQKDNLVIRQKPNYGLKIHGKEVDFRKPLVDIYFSIFKQGSLFYDLLKYEKPDNPTVEVIILQIIQAYNISISDISLCDFLLCISASILRMRLGFYLTEVDDSHDLQDTVPFLAAKKIAHALEVQLDMTIPDEEVFQFGIELISKCMTTTAILYHHDKASYLAEKSFYRIKDTTCIELSHQDALVEELICYIQGVLLRQRFNTKLRNPLYLDVKQKHPLSYTLATTISTVFVEEGHHPLSLSELSYFTIILNTAIQKNLQTKQNVLLISGLSTATTQLIAWQINHRFGNEIIITETTQYYLLRQLDLNQYDFIISTIPIHTTLSIPTLHVSPIIYDDDFNKINKYLAHNFRSHNLSIHFHPNLFTANFTLEKKADILPSFYTLLKENLVLQNHSFKNDLDKKQGITIYEYHHLISVIRYNKAINNTNTISVIINDKPILGDLKNIQILILVAFKKADDHLATAMMNLFMQLSQQKQLVDALLSNPSYQNFIYILESINEKVNYQKSKAE